MRFEVETNLYNPSALAKKFSSIQTNFDVTLGKISAILSDSEIEEYLDGHTTMNSRLSSVVQDLSGVHTQISTMQTDYEDGFQSVDSRLTTVDETITGIRAEVSSVHSEYNGLETRVSSAETKITDSAIVATVRSSDSYKSDLASKNATFTGDYVPTTSNAPASSWNTTALKESHLNDTFLTSGGELYQYISGHNGLMITFSSDSKTEATRYDYVRIYYKIGDTTYVLPDIGGTDISGASIFVPSNEFWLYWRSDRSQVYYGFRIASIEWVFSNTPTLTEATLPGIDPTPMSGTNYPETTHPYTNNEEKFWKYTHTGHSASVNPSYGWAKREDSGIRTLTERMSAAELKITDSAIVSTVRSSAAYTGDLAGKTSSADVESIIEQKADSIRLKADKISWQSTYSSMTENGVLTCTGANISGQVNIGGYNNEKGELILYGSNNSAVARINVNGYHAYANRLPYVFIKDTAPTCYFSGQGTLDMYGSSLVFDNGTNRHGISANIIYQNGNSSGSGAVATITNHLNLLTTGGFSVYFANKDAAIFKTSYDSYNNTGYIQTAQVWINTAITLKGINNQNQLRCNTPISAPGFYADSTSSKSKLMDTEDYGDRLVYCYETAEPLYGDVGSAETDIDGICAIPIDDVFIQTTDDSCDYQVFLQKEGQGDIWVEEKQYNYFVVRGTQNLKFSWEVKMTQKYFNGNRLERIEDWDIESNAGINEYIKDAEESYDLYGDIFTYEQEVLFNETT